MMGGARRLVEMIGKRYLRSLCRHEFEHQVFHWLNERPVEYAFVFRYLAEVYPRTVLDVGTGTTALPSLIRSCGCLVTATDNVQDYWPRGMLNRHYHVIHDDITASRLSGVFDLVTCVSVLEHIEKSDQAVRNMFKLLRRGGHMILTFPYTERFYVRNVYELPGAAYGPGQPYITQSYSRTELSRWSQDNAATILAQEYWQFWDGDYWNVGARVVPPKRVSAEDKHQLTCVLLQKTMD